MTNLDQWNAFLQDHGARFTGQAISHFSQNKDFNAWDAGFLTSLSDLGMIAANGEEAASFLHNQLTNDINHLPEQGVRLAGYCTPKGRLLATLMVFRDQSHYYLQMPQSILPPLLKRLKMYLLRSKATLRDASDERIVLAMGGQAAGSALAPWFDALPATPYALTSNQHGQLLRVADAFGHPRYQWLLGLEQAQQVWPQLAANLAPAPAHVWAQAEVLAGVPHILPATQEKFVPQMINLELLGAVNFKKGCYPGQEIVARSQYLGKVKRRMVLAKVTADQVDPGMEVFTEADPEQGCGMVVNATPHSQGSWLALVEIKLEFLASGVHLQDIHGPKLDFQTLPYALQSAEN